MLRKRWKIMLVFKFLLCWRLMSWVHQSACSFIVFLGSRRRPFSNRSSPSTLKPGMVYYIKLKQLNNDALVLLMFIFLLIFYSVRTPYESCEIICNCICSLRVFWMISWKCFKHCSLGVRRNASLNMYAYSYSLGNYPIFFEFCCYWASSKKVYNTLPYHSQVLRVILDSIICY